MKKYITILMLMTAIVGCKKTEVIVCEADETIVGKWELRSTFCGWSAGRINYPLGNGTTLTFNSNGQYTAAGNRVDSGVYRITTQTNGQGQTETLLYLGGNWNREFRFAITGTSFILDENAYTYDGCEYRYQKLR